MGAILDIITYAQQRLTKSAPLFELYINIVSASAIDSGAVKNDRQGPLRSSNPCTL